MDKEAILKGWAMAAAEEGITFDSFMNRLAYQVTVDRGAPKEIKELVDEWWNDHPFMENKGM